MVLRVFRTVRNHWKKSLFAAGVTGYAIHHFYNKHVIKQMMRSYCLEAQKLGEERLEPFRSSRHVTVILNPEAKGRKCKPQFEQYVAPILHCAGIRVSVIETETQGQAGQLMQVMQNTDGVLIAGGDGTLHEAITGMLRRTDAERISKTMPVGALPLGKKSQSFKSLQEKEGQKEKTLFSWESSKVQEVRSLVEAAMRVARDEQRKANVLEVHYPDKNESLYALNKFEFGQLSWLSSKFKYWYLGEFVGQYYALVRNTFWQSLDNLILIKDLDLMYMKPCQGCSRCFKRYFPQETAPAVVPRSSWWSFLGLSSAGKKKLDPITWQLEQKMKNFENNDCGVWHRMPLPDVFNIRVDNQPLYSPELLNVQIHSKDEKLDKIQFFANVRSYAKGDDSKKCATNVDAKEVFLCLPENLLPSSSSQQIKEEILDTEISQEQTADSLKPSEKSGQQSAASEQETGPTFKVDSENYERQQRLHLRSLPQQLLMYK